MPSVATCSAMIISQATVRSGSPLRRFDRQLWQIRTAAEGRLSCAHRSNDLLRDFSSRVLWPSAPVAPMREAGAVVAPVTSSALPPPLAAPHRIAAIKEGASRPTHLNPGSTRTATLIAIAGMAHSMAAIPAGIEAADSFALAGPSETQERFAGLSLRSNDG